MATQAVKYFSGMQEVIYPRPLANARFVLRFGDAAAKPYDGISKMVAYHPNNTRDGNELPVTRIVDFQKFPSLHKCDARCRHAKGRSCECSCGGANHGIAA